MSRHDLTPGDIAERDQDMAVIRDLTREALKDFTPGADPVEAAHDAMFLLGPVFTKGSELLGIPMTLVGAIIAGQLAVELAEAKRQAAIPRDEVN